MVHRVSRRSKE